MKMASQVDTAFYRPGHQVWRALGDCLVAVWADPSFAVFGVLSGGWLNRVIFASSGLDALGTATSQIKVQLRRLFLLFPVLLWPIASRH